MAWTLPRRKAPGAHLFNCNMAAFNVALYWLSDPAHQDVPLTLFSGPPFTSHFFRHEKPPAPGRAGPLYFIYHK